ncbi:MAG: nitroreductase family protein [Candidatus Brocadiia bacterium]
MNVIDAICERRSVRSYEDREVEEEKLEQVLDAGRRAPSANNRQNWKFIVVRDADLRAKLVEAANGQKFVGQAPVVIAACATSTDHVMSCGHPDYLVNLAIAIDHMTLAACELGLGSCWIGAFDQQKVTDLLNIPDEASVVELLPLGYPAVEPGQKSRKSLEEVVSYDGWA